MSTPTTPLPAGGAPGPTPPRPSAPTGLRILLWLGGGLLLTMLVLMGTCTWCVMSNPEARKMGALLGESVRMGLAATKAPGAEALRAAGCSEAMVMDMRDFMRLIAELDRKAEQQPDPPDWQTMVICQVTSSATTLTCQEVARAYGRAVAQAPARFAVAVQVQLPRQDICQGLYGPDGTRHGDLGNFEQRFHFGSGEPDGSAAALPDAGGASDGAEERLPEAEGEPE